ncbi:MAG: ThiF family adenylyltransferase [Nitrososphaeraceae archaeon]
MKKNKMAKVEFVIPSVLNKSNGERKISLDANDLSDAFTKITDQMGEDFKRRVFDVNSKPRALINIYLNGKNIRFSNDGMSSLLKDGDSVFILPAVAGGTEFTNEDIQRYSRQIMLEEIGFIGMESLRNAKICVVGVGGIGNPVVTQLAAMGIGNLKLVDRDVVEISNLHRQHLYTEDDLGKVKVEAALDRLRKINSATNIEAVPISITKYTADSVVKNADVVIDALDSVDARYALNDACIKYNVPFIYAGALGTVGSVCTILPKKSACLRCIFPALSEDNMPTCSTEGVHPSILYIVGAIQVSEAIKIITRQEPSLVNKLMYIDLNDLSFEKIQMFRQQECPSCGSNGKGETENAVIIQNHLIVEELCGRDRGKRTYTLTPSDSSSPINLDNIIKTAESLGYRVKARGNLGLTAINDKTSVSFLTSGTATIVGAADEKEALSIYRTFAQVN